MNKIKPFVSIVILVFNGKRWIDACLTSVCLTKYENFKIIVVDNASTDNSCEGIEGKFTKVECIRNEINLGFSEGNNVGIRHALAIGADYIAILNQDTKVHPKWIEELVTVLINNKSLGILSPTQFNYDGTDFDENFKKMICDDINLGDILVEKISTYPIKFIIGAGVIFSKVFLLKVGLFDPLFFCYGEDSDLSNRAKYHGFTLEAVTKSKIYHWHSLTSESKGRKNEFNEPRIKGMLLYALKNHNRCLLVNILTYLKLTGYVFKSISSKNILKFICIQIWFFSHLPLVIFKRSNEKKKACYLIGTPV